MVDQIFPRWNPLTRAGDAGERWFVALREAIISLSTLSPNGQSYTVLAVARVDATSGEIVEFKEQEDTPAADSPSREP